MINFEVEKSLALDAQERYDIIAMAIDAADDNGFINSFILERALCCYAAIILYPERGEAISEATSKDLLSSWKNLIEDDTIKTMREEYADTLEVLFKEAEIWYSEYSDYAHSARGVLEMVQSFTGDITQGAAKLLTNTAQETGVQDLLEVADEWGMRRNALAPKAEKNNSDIVESESLFQ